MYQSSHLSQFFDHIKPALAESVYQRDNSFDLVKYLVLMSMLVVFLGTFIGGWLSKNTWITFVLKKLISGLLLTTIKVTKMT